MRALAFLSVLLVVEGATAGTTVPVEPQLVAPAEVVVATVHEGVVLDVQTTPGLVANWTAPASLGSGSATFAFDVSSGRLTVASAGSFVVSGAVPLEDYSVGASLGPNGPEFQIAVPDFGESMTSIAFVGRQTGEVSRSGRQGWVDASVGLRTFASTLLAGDFNLVPPLSLPPDFSLGLRILKDDPNTLADSADLIGAYFPFPAGDTITLTVPMEVGSGCNALVGTSTCSVTWDVDLELDVLAIAPEAQNRPQTQCFDAVDNDLDGLIDLEDPNCSDPYDTTEGPPPPLTGGCGLGLELVLLLPAIGWLRRRRRGRSGG
jgi:hypothetical protein